MGRKTNENLIRKKHLFKFSFILIICLTMIIEINIFYKGYSVIPEKADVIIVLGCSVWGDTPSPTLQQRINKAYQLYKEGYAGKLIASGSKGYGENLYEATVIKKQLVRLGVPEENIIEETKSTNTRENLTFSKEIMKKYKFQSSLIITNYFHIYRSSMIAKDLQLKAYFGRAYMPSSILTIIFSNIREVASVIKYFILQVV